MALIGNVLWFVTGGFAFASLWLLLAVSATITLVFAPLAPACLRLAKFSAAPFGFDIVSKRVLDNASGDAGAMVTRAGLNTLWLVLVGWWVAAFHVLWGAVCCVTVVGIPFGIQYFKLAGAAWWPVGREVVTLEAAKLAKQDFARTALDARRSRSQPVV